MGMAASRDEENARTEPVSQEPVSQTLTIRPVPRLSEQDLTVARELSAKLDHKDPRQVLMFGDQVQSRVAEFSDSLLGNASIGESGRVGELLGALKGQIQQIDPQDLKGSPSIIGRMLEMLPWASSVQEKISSMVTRHEKIKPAIDKISEDLGLEEQKVGITLEQLGELERENRQYITSLRVVKAALTLALNDATGSYEELRKQVQGSDDPLEISEVRRDWDNLQRMDRRLYAIEASLALANTNDSQVGRLRETLMYNAETLAEARTIMLPAWKTNMSLAITALQARDQAELVEAFRRMTDDLLTNTGDLIGSIESQQASMQQRTFVSAEVIARVNEQIATSIDSVLDKQRDAKKIRDEGIRLITESQQKLIAAMKDSGEKLVEATGTNVSLLPAREYDISAELLQKRPDSVPVPRHQ